MRLATRILPLLLLTAALVGGCGSDESETTAPGATAPETTAPETTAPETTKAQQSGAGGPAAPIGVKARSCRDNGDESRLLRVTGVNCGSAEKIASGWDEDSSCRPPQGQSRSACAVGAYRCLSTAVGRGLAVSCARSQRSIAFIARR